LRKRGVSDVEIRDARPGDEETIREVTLAAYQEYAAELPAHWDAYRRNIVTTLAELGSAEQMVAERDGRIVGAVLLYPTGAFTPTPEGEPVGMRWPEVRLLAVAPSERGGGIGAALMRECVRRARGAGAPALTLHTTDMMRVAMRLYERLGFVAVPELDLHPAPGLTVKGYRLSLAAGPS
jgi:GNAT superfamily N-acetyltransferase